MASNHQILVVDDDADLRDSLQIILEKHGYVVRTAKDGQEALALAEADSRLGATSEGAGVRRGGLFTPSLIRYKIGMLEDVLDRQLAGPSQ